jgi:hypothetical protein
MMSNIAISAEDKDWLDNKFPVYRGKTLIGETLMAYYEAERILEGWQGIKKRDCTCEYGSLASKVHALYGRYKK